MMTRLQKPTEKNLMASTWTKAGKVRRAFKAGRPRQTNRLVTPTVAIHEACIALERLQDEMRKEELLEQDVQAALVIMTPQTPDRENLVYVQGIPDTKRLPEVFASVRKIEVPEKMLVIGILFKQRDREAKKDAVWPQPYLVGDRAQKAMLTGGQMFQEMEKGTACSAMLN
jgi:hypothetical protein